MLPLNQLEASLPGRSEVEESRRRAGIEGIGWQGGGGRGGGGGFMGAMHGFVSLYIVNYYIIRGYAIKCNY